MTEALVDSRESEAIARERQLIVEAVQGVAEGHFRRVTVAGLEFGALLLEEARNMAREAGVRVRPVSAGNLAAIDLIVEVGSLHVVATPVDETDDELPIATSPEAQAG